MADDTPTTRGRVGLPPAQPDIDRLVTALNNSKISVSNNALYQTIFGLIRKISQFQGLTNISIEDLQTAIDNLTNLINNITITGQQQIPQLWMPTFDGVDGDDAFPIPGPSGKDGMDGKTIPCFEPHNCEADPLIPFYGCCDSGAFGASEFTSTTTGNIDDLDFSNARLIRMNNATASTIRGLKAGLSGQRVTIVSIGAGQVNFNHQDTNSVAANRLINFVTLGTTPIAAGVGYVTFVYDATTARWRLESHEQGAWISVVFNAADFTGNGALTWTVTSGDVLTDKFRISGRTMIYSFQYDVTTPGGVTNTTLIRAIVGGYTVASGSQQPNAVTDNLIPETGKCFVSAAGTTLNFRRAGNANWTLGANIAGVFGVLNLELQ